MTDREQIVNEFEHEVRKAHGEGWDYVDLLTEDGFKILTLLKEQETMNECLEKKCVICPHCNNCDVDENGMLKEQDSGSRRATGADIGNTAQCGLMPAT